MSGAASLHATLWFTIRVSSLDSDVRTMMRLAFGRSSLRQVVALSAALLIAACAGAGDDSEDPVAPSTGAVAVSVATPTLAVKVGSSAQSTVTLTRGGGFTGTTFLDSRLVPSGVTVTFTPPQLNTGVTTAAVTVAVAASVTVKSFAFTILAVPIDTKIANGETTLTVTVAPCVWKVATWCVRGLGAGSDVELMPGRVRMAAASSWFAEFAARDHSVAGGARCARVIVVAVPRRRSARRDILISLSRWGAVIGRAGMCG